MLPAKNYENLSDDSPLHRKLRKTSAHSVPILIPTKLHFLGKNGTIPIQPFSKVNNEDGQGERES